VPSCWEQQGFGGYNYGRNRIGGTNPLADEQGKFGNAAFLDMTDLLCNGAQCPSVIGNVFVYLDDNHLSKTYVTSMGEMFDERWFAATGWAQ